MDIISRLSFADHLALYSVHDRSDEQMHEDSAQGLRARLPALSAGDSHVPREVRNPLATIS